MQAYVVAMGSLGGLCVALWAWLEWTNRRGIRAYRRWRGGQWGCVREQRRWGYLRRWTPMAEIQEGEHIVEVETWPPRTRVRADRRKP